MTAAMIAEIVSMFLWLVAGACDECPPGLDARRVAQIRRERNMSEEERRLDRFWRGFYAAQARYYSDLDKLDWVAYYKNHGVQINSVSDPSRVQYAPVVVTPRPLPGSAAPSSPNVAPQPAPPGLPAAPPITPQPDWERADWENYYNVLRRYYDTLDKVDWVAYYKNHGVQINNDNGGASRIQFTPVFVGPSAQGPPGLPVAPPPGPANPLPSIPPAGPALPKSPTPLQTTPSAKWTLEMKLAEAQAAGPAKDLCNWPNIHVEVDGAFVVPGENLIALRTGTAADLRADTYVQVGLSGGHAHLGTEIKGTITQLAPKRVRLDVTVEKQEVENAGKKHVLIVGKTYRLAQQLQVGQRTKVVLQSNAAGEPTLWLELLVAEVGATAPAQGIQPPIPALPSWGGKRW